MILVVGSIRLPAARLAEAMPHIARLVTDSAQEDGCIGYSFAADLFDPGLIRIAEQWRDEAALAAHAQAPHSVAWRAAGAELGVSERALTVHTVDSSRPL